MLGPGLTIIAQPWRRHRAGMLFTGAALVGLLASGLLGVTGSVEHGLGPYGRAVNLVLIVALSVASGYILNAVLFLDREGDLSSGYPRRLFVAPVSDATLVFWPMLMSVVTALGLCSLAYAILPYGAEGSTALAAALGMVATVSWLQALVWCPFGAGWYRMLVSVLAFSLLVWPPLIASEVYQCQLPWTLLMASYTLGAWALSYWAVKAARHGEVWMPRLKGERLVDAVSRAMVRVRPFRSPASAQLWYETRCHALVLPGLVLWFLAFCAICATVLGRNQFHVGMILGVVVSSPIFLAPTAGPGFGRFLPFWMPRGSPIAFPGVRPMTTQAFVVAKLRNAVTTVLLAWALAAVLFVIAIALESAWGDLDELATKAFKPYGVPSRWLIAGLSLIAGPALSWRFLTSGLPAGLSGRRWVAEGYSWAFAAGMMSLIIPVIWFAGHRESIPAWIEAFPLFVMALAPCKALAALIAFRTAVERRLIDGRYIAVALAVWLLLAVCFGGLAWLALAPFDLPWSRFWLLAAGAILAPLARFALAPLALDWNRHR
jgi:hypothetical protein